MFEAFLDDPNVGVEEKEYLSKAIDSGYVSTIGPFVGEFETRFQDRFKTGYAVSTQSGTAALHMALCELGVGVGDEVIVPSLTFVASVNPIYYVGAVPVFVDVDPKTWTIDPKKIEAKITSKTKAIIPVHLYGNPCDMNSLRELASRYGLGVIDDAAESLGATCDGKPLGSFSDFSCFSFNGNKVMTTGGGGMVTSASKEKIDHIRYAINQARDTERGYFHSEVGYNYRMTNIEAAIGLAQLGKMDSFLEKKKQYNQIYTDILGSVSGVTFQSNYENCNSSFWLISIQLKNLKSVADFQIKLRDKGVPTRRLFHPVHDFSYHPKRIGRVYTLDLILRIDFLHTEKKR